MLYTHREKVLSSICFLSSLIWFEINSFLTKLISFLSDHLGDRFKWGFPPVVSYLTDRVWLPNEMYCIDDSNNFISTYAILTHRNRSIWPLFFSVFTLDLNNNFVQKWADVQLDATDTVKTNHTSNRDIVVVSQVT